MSELQGAGDYGFAMGMGKGAQEFFELFGVPGLVALGFGAISMGILYSQTQLSLGAEAGIAAAVFVATLLISIYVAYRTEQHQAAIKAHTTQKKPKETPIEIGIVAAIALGFTGALVTFAATYSFAANNLKPAIQMTTMIGGGIFLLCLALGVIASARNTLSKSKQTHDVPLTMHTPSSEH